MNIIIRDNDTIYVPSPETGEFYLMGEIERPGVYALTGRRTTIKQAVAAGGNVTRAAWPENSYLIRRIGASQEQVTPINLEKIFAGEEPDIYLKPNDIIAVGTHAAVPFLAALRGIVPTLTTGFSYARNFTPDIPVDDSHQRFKRGW